MKLVVVADGDPFAQTTNSGVARGVSLALRGRSDCEIVAAIDSSIVGWRRIILAAATFRPSRKWWWAALNLGLLNIALRSIARDRQVSRLGFDVDYVLQIRNVYFPSRFPYLVFIDSTTDMANAGWGEWRPSLLSRQIRRKIEERQYLNARHVFTAGAQAALDLERGYGLPSNRITAIGGGVNYDIFPPVVDREERTVQNLLFVGTDFNRKGGDILLKAFSILRKSNPLLSLTIVGPARFEPQVDGVSFLGLVKSRNEMAKLYRAADLLCHPARHEPYGLVLQEAMAFGLPCIATNVGALSTIVDDGVTGLLVRSGDVSDLAAGIQTLIDNRKQAHRFGAAGRAKVFDNYTWAAVADRLIAALKANPS